MDDSPQHLEISKQSNVARSEYHDELGDPFSDEIRKERRDTREPDVIISLDLGGVDVA